MSSNHLEIKTGYRSHSVRAEQEYFHAISFGTSGVIASVLVQVLFSLALKNFAWIFK